MDYDDQLRLVTPREDLRDAFLDMVADFHTTDQNWPHGANRVSMLAINDFPAYCGQMARNAKGEDLPEGYVPCTMFWLMDGNRMIGTLSLCHRLNEHLLNEGGHIGYCVRPSERRKGYMTRFLGLGLREALKIGIDRVLITCDDDNIASARVIEKCGGVLEDKRPCAARPGVLKRRYWIDLAEEDGR